MCMCIGVSVCLCYRMSQYFGKNQHNNRDILRTLSLCGVGGVVGWVEVVCAQIFVKPNFGYIVVELTLSSGFDNFHLVANSETEEGFINSQEYFILVMF